MGGGGGGGGCGGGGGGGCSPKPRGVMRPCRNMRYDMRNGDLQFACT